MKICDYGCGQIAEYEFKSGKLCCSKNAGGCPEVIRKRAEKRRGYQHTEETKRKLGNARRGMKLSEEWRRKIGDASRGRKNKPHSEETKRKISQANKGKAAWNKGLTAETDERVRQYTEAQTGQKRIGNYVANCDWSGENNPWYGKDRSRENSPRYNGKAFNREFKNYRNQVDYATRMIYEANKDKINPNSLPLGKAGVDGAHHIDHIVSVRYGFEHDIPVELMATPSNLRVIPWLDNIQKYDKIDESQIPTIIKQFLENI